MLIPDCEEVDIIIAGGKKFKSYSPGKRLLIEGLSKEELLGVL